MNNKLKRPISDLSTEEIRNIGVSAAKQAVKDWFQVEDIYDVWFAWRPVRCEDTNRIVWLKRIWKRRTLHLYPSIYGYFSEKEVRYYENLL